MHLRGMQLPCLSPLLCPTPSLGKLISALLQCARSILGVNCRSCLFKKAISFLYLHLILRFENVQATSRP
uniref:Putative secreted protein n=1 Tax=Ixodes ricinus TaxID=34613 RepID=A0A147BP44_IXORI